MNNAPGTSGESSENTLMQVLTGILEDSVQTLQRIEKAVAESTKVARTMVEKIDLIDKKIESGFVAVVKKALPALEQNFSDKIDQVGAFGEVSAMLPDIISKLQQSMQILTIQNLIGELDKVPSGKPKEKAKEEAREESPTKKKKIKTPDTTPGSAPQDEVAQIQEAAKKEEKEDGEDHLLRPSSFFGS